MIQWVRLFVVWMIQTKKQTAIETVANSQQNKTSKRKHQKNRKRTFWCWKVERLSELFVVWMTQNQTKTAQTRGSLFKHKNFFVRFQKRFPSSLPSSPNQNEAQHQNVPKTNESKSSLCCKMIHSIGCLLLGWFKPKNKQTNHGAFHNRTIVQKQKT